MQTTYNTKLLAPLRIPQQTTLDYIQRNSFGTAGTAPIQGVLSAEFQNYKGFNTRIEAGLCMDLFPINWFKRPT